MNRKTHIPVENETKSSATRTTNDGRAITYEMQVLQQPQRARACGQGAKSSADRRPVDPPPIVELKIFEGEKRDDITYTMHANYFLFATLEQARPIAHARGQDRNTHPVLTGTPVAGMVYLDRPTPAGYFIFPDLSVRHEGEYRLSFSLYEELKNPKDEDKPEEACDAAGGDAHVTHRLEVKSAPFHVYSAKKFPGLTESTHLSRMVAEQGCRVRIRRDVRMRRREPKSGGKDWDEYEEDTAAARARASATPDPSINGYMQTPHGFIEPNPRPRSASNASHQSLGSISRRPSMQEMGQAYHQQPHYGTAPHTPQNGYTQTAPYGPPPGQQYPPNQFVQQQPPMQPPLPQYQPPNYPAPPPPVTAAQQPQPAQSYYNYPAAPPPPQATQVQQYNVSAHAYDSGVQSHRPSIDFPAQDGYRRNSQQIPPTSQPTAYTQPMQPQYAAQMPPAQHYQQPPPPPPSQASQHSSYSSMDLYNSRPAPIEPHHHGNTPASKASFDLPPINTAAMVSNKLEASSPTSVAPTNAYFSGGQTPIDTHKRSYGDVFSNRHHNAPLRQGQRPSYGQGDSLVTGTTMSAADDDDNASSELDPSTLGMHYRRADGRQIQRALPGHA
ncbi:velvet-like regulatory protein [Dothistroma septosporum NZE10]|uniref:Developmental and secondary metabolism regulator veA n=1 Tax=Dothistroma septosporum (strain NZE10 / CBS 128990) TaxID=675120 RepID=VEA_DOTSN|nr:RecName: Full=Developmental and secondary metabolism regulator veA; AltName: Full=Velvet complex subunit A [Dothistroma septosporum NZE10]EME47645.1 velvet-like regulatory protein [Dothistroma septosporum NZE10]